MPVEVSRPISESPFIITYLMLPLAAMGVIAPSYEQLCGNIVEILLFNSHRLVLLGFNNVQPLVSSCVSIETRRAFRLSNGNRFLS